MERYVAIVAKSGNMYALVEINSDTLFISERVMVNGNDIASAVAGCRPINFSIQNGVVIESMGKLERLATKDGVSPHIVVQEFVDSSGKTVGYRLFNPFNNSIISMRKEDIIARQMVSSIPLLQNGIIRGGSVCCYSNSSFPKVVINTDNKSSNNSNQQNIIKEWGRKNNIHPLIVAYLCSKPNRFSPAASSNGYASGTVSPNPATWNKLSKELKLHSEYGHSVSGSKLESIAARHIGSKEGGEFAAFCACFDKLPYKASNIIAGKEKKPSPMKEESFYIILESCISSINRIMKDTLISGWNYPASTYKSLANMVDWFLEYEEFDLKLTIDAIIEMRNSIPNFGEIMYEKGFLKYSSKMDKFIDNHVDSLSVYL